MKSADVVRVIAEELGSPEIAEMNKLLKSEASQKIKFKISGKKLGQLGYTVAIKMITNEGLKFFGVNRVSLVKFVDIESFAKAKPRVARPARPKKTALIIPKPAVIAITPRASGPSQKVSIRPQKFFVSPKKPGVR